MYAAKCPKCGWTKSFPPLYANRAIECGGCGERFRLPDETAFVEETPKTTEALLTEIWKDVRRARKVLDSLHLLIVVTVIVAAALTAFGLLFFLEFGL